MTLWISEMLITSTIGERLWAKVPTKSCNCYTKYVGLHVQYDHGRVYTEHADSVAIDGGYYTCSKFLSIGWAGSKFEIMLKMASWPPNPLSFINDISFLKPV